MARINQASLRAQIDDSRTQFEAIKQHGEASAEQATYGVRSRSSSRVRP